MDPAHWDPGTLTAPTGGRHGANPMGSEPGELYELHLERDEIELLHDPVLIIALDGYIDAGSGVRLAVEHLLSNLPNTVIGTFDVDQLIDYRARRPILTYQQNAFTDYRQPELQVRLLTDTDGTAFLLLSGPEPDSQWERFIAAVGQIADRFAVRLTVGLMAIPMGVPHTRPTGMSSHATRAGLLPDQEDWLGVDPGAGPCRRAARVPVRPGRPRCDRVRRARPALHRPLRLPGDRPHPGPGHRRRHRPAATHQRAGRGGRQGARPSWPSRSRTTPRSPRSSRAWSSSTTPMSPRPDRACSPSPRRCPRPTSWARNSRPSWPIGSRPQPDPVRTPAGPGPDRVTCVFGVLCALVAHENPTLALPVKEHGPVRAIGLRIVVAVMCVVVTTVVVYLERAGLPRPGRAGRHLARRPLLRHGHPVDHRLRRHHPGHRGRPIDQHRVITPLRFLFLIVLVGTTIEVLTERSRQQFRYAPLEETREEAHGRHRLRHEGTFRRRGPDRPGLPGRSHRRGGQRRRRASRRRPATGASACSATPGARRSCGRPRCPARPR